MKLSDVAKEFVESPSFKEGCIDSTKASWGGGWYSVELFTNGTWRVLWNNQIGNKYPHDNSEIAPCHK